MDPNILTAIRVLWMVGMMMLSALLGAAVWESVREYLPKHGKES